MKKIIVMKVFFGDEDVVMFNDVKYLLSDDEIRMFKERPTTLRAPTASTSIRSRAPTASTRSKAPIASSSAVKVAFHYSKRGLKQWEPTIGIRAMGWIRD
ncbi:hypothetical protein Tco_0407755 [Tanacetum coccineum]